jgi:alpha-1,3/alpha-1,6-mannosyltransferase
MKYSNAILSTFIGGKAKQLYRFFLDNIEEFTTGCADMILVNSEFTKSVFRESFTRLAALPITTMYPVLTCLEDEQADNENTDDSLFYIPHIPHIPNIPHSSKFNRSKCKVFVSLNRYERKKNVVLALDALAVLKTLLRSHKQQGERGERVILVVAGGYDRRVLENMEYLEVYKLYSIHYTLYTIHCTLYSMRD